jgi:hypothetical protein
LECSSHPWELRVGAEIRREFLQGICRRPASAGCAEGVPPGVSRQRPAAARRSGIASRDPNARVIYGANTDRRNDGWWDPNENPRNTGRAIPRPSPYPTDRYPSTRYPNTRGTYRYTSVAFDNGYNDGLDKGREDSRDRDSYDLNRHSRYRSADHGYEKRYGSKDDYRQIYRDGFRAGYDDAFRGSNTRRRDFPWPF